MGAVMGTLGCDDAILGAFVMSASRKSLSFCRHSVYSGTAAGSGDVDSAAVTRRSVSCRSWSKRDAPGRTSVEHNAITDARGVGVGDETMIGPIMCDGGSEIYLGTILYLQCALEVH